MLADNPLLTAVLAVELLVLALAATLYLGHGLWLAATDAGSAARLAAARRALMLALAEPAESRSDLAALRALPPRPRREIVAEIAPSLSGAQGARLGEVADALGLTAAAEADCGSRLWWRRLHAARLLALIGRGQAVVPPLLADPDPRVRAEAAGWAADHPEPSTLEALIDLLERDRASRFAVQDALLRLGERATPALAAYLESNGGEAVEPALRVAIGLAGPGLLAPALRLADDPSPGVRAAAAELLGAIGGEAAVGALVAMTADAAAPARRAAARALARLSHWPAAGRLAGLLGDDDWEVRREAALALRALGPTGQVLLRRAAAAEGTPAGEIARLALAAPELA